MNKNIKEKYDHLKVAIYLIYYLISERNFYSLSEIIDIFLSF